MVKTILLKLDNKDFKRADELKDIIDYRSWEAMFNDLVLDVWREHRARQELKHG